MTISEKKKALVIAKARRLLPYGWTPLGAVKAYLYYFRLPTKDDLIKKLVKAVRQVKQPEKPANDEYHPAS